MLPTMQMQSSVAACPPGMDAMGRHEYGIMKNRKCASTGGGRAWSEDEELYLVETRLRKMPYKHIAAHLRKTELACRLHFHQLTHGSNRRKRTASVSSSSSTSGHSPLTVASVPLPIQEHGDVGDQPSSTPPPGSAGSYGLGLPTNAKLPSIKNGVRSMSPGLPTILPKPAYVTLVPASRGYPTPARDSHPQSASASYRESTTPTTVTPHPTSPLTPRLHGRLRLDCSDLPPPTDSTGLECSITSTATQNNVEHAGDISHPVDMSRLASIYATHQSAFWAAIAAEYGNGANPAVLEQAWRGNSSSTNQMGYPGSQMTPITPGGSPDEHVSCKQDKTRISAILGIDANPRSPREREMVRRIEEEKIAVISV